MSDKVPYPPPPEVEDLGRSVALVLRNIRVARRGEPPRPMSADDEKVGRWLQQCEQVRLENYE